MTQERMFTVSIFQRIVRASAVDSGMQFQTVNRTGQLVLRRHVPAPPAFNVCACSVAPNCPDPSWSGGMFICQYGHNCTAGSVVWRIPGFAKTCSIVETFAASDLRCFYDQTCVNTMLSMFNVDLPNRVPLSPSTLAVVALNASIPSISRLNDTLSRIVHRLMLEEWTMASDFETYYGDCAPSYCTYTVDRRMDLAYVFTTTLGLYGGLSVSLNLLVPVIVYLIYRLLFHRCRNGNHDINRERKSL